MSETSLPKVNSGKPTPLAVEKKLKSGIGICLSGGGFRAMLFHVGALWRLNEVGLLTRADRISSVSGGSITAGWLALLWAKNGWGVSGIPQDDFRYIFAGGLRRLAAHLIDIPSVLKGFAPCHNVGQEVANYYDRYLYQGATLQDLPEKPRFVINSSNLQTGVLWRFSKPYMGDYKVGRVLTPRIRLAIAVAASSAFPPVLSPLELELMPEQYTLDGTETLHRRPFTTRPVLSDGGVYDNLGLEPVFKEFETVLVSDGGVSFQEQEEPSRVWPLQLKRVIDCMDNQVGALRKRDLMENYQTGQRKGTYWGIGTPLMRYPKPSRLLCSPETTIRLAMIKTRLAGMKSTLQEELINWGYAACSASLDSYFPQHGPPPSWPYPQTPLG